MIILIKTECLTTGNPFKYILVSVASNLRPFLNSF
jgi:hypothetical protein